VVRSKKEGRPQEALLCAKAKRQQQMFYLCVSGKEPSRNGNQPYAMMMILFIQLYSIKVDSGAIHFLVKR